MKHPLLSLVFIPALFIGACTPPPEQVVEAPATPTPTPAPTPHPATGAIAAATLSYPDLGKLDSTFNRTFRDLYEELSANNPEALTRADWPITLARRTGGLLGVSPSRPEPATPTPIPATPAPTWFEQRMQNQRSLDAAPHSQKGYRRYYYDGSRRYYNDDSGVRVYQ